MKKIYYIAAAFTFMSFTACGDGVDLPNPGVETDLNKIPLPENELDLVQVELKDDANLWCILDFMRRRLCTYS